MLGIGIDRVGLDYRILRGRFTIADLRADAGPPAAIGRPDTWLGSGVKRTDVLAPYALPVDGGSPTSLTLDLLSDRSGVRISAKGAVGELPAFVVGALPAGTAPGGLSKAPASTGSPSSSNRSACCPTRPAAPPTWRS